MLLKDSVGNLALRGSVLRGESQKILSLYFPTQYNRRPSLSQFEFDLLYNYTHMNICIDIHETEGFGIHVESLRRNVQSEIHPSNLEDKSTSF